LSRRTPYLTAIAVVLMTGLALVFTPEAQAQYFGKNKIKYSNFDWGVYHSVHFDVYYYPEEEHLLEKIVSYAESAYDELSRELDHQVTDPIPLIFYATHAEFEQNNIILNFIPEGIGAFAVPTRNRMVMPVDLPDRELMQLMLHELTHVFQFSMLFEGRTGKGLRSQPPQWLMEGMASYMAKDESARDKGYLRDAVVNDRIPSVSQGNVGGFFAYRFGHAVLDYVEERWGKDGIRDFLEELRNNLGGSMGRIFERTFQIKPEDMDADFRRWLRRKYLPELVSTGEPSDYGRIFRREYTIFSGVTSSPAPSPSGDLVAVFSTHKGVIDIVLYDTQSREMVKNLTKGIANEYDYIVAQELTLGRKMGRDLAFSPDGNTIAFFARQGRGRKLFLLNVLTSKLDDVIDLPDVSQPTAPAWSPDGRKVAFGAHKEGYFDIFAVDVATEQLEQITNDEIFDAAPIYDPDGESILLTSEVAGYGKIFRINLSDPSRRIQMTFGESNDTDAILSPDGERLFFTSDRTGSDDIYGLNLAKGELTQHTNAVTTCFQPNVLSSPDGRERLVYTAFWKGRLDTYTLDLKEPITPGKIVDESALLDLEDFEVADLGEFEPSIEVTLDDANKDDFQRFKFILEDADFYVGVDDNQTVIGSTVIRFTDYLGDRRLVGYFQGVSGFQQLRLQYADLSRRWQWDVQLFDDESFFIGRNIFERGETAYSELGVLGTISYPINPSHRWEIGAGFTQRELNFQTFALADTDLFTLEELIALEPLLGGLGLEDLTDEELDVFLDTIYPQGIRVGLLDPRQDDYPLLTTALVGDTTSFAPWGPIEGRRWRVSATSAYSLDASAELFTNLGIDFRQYFKLTPRSNFAIRFVGSFNQGVAPNPVYFGGLDTVRGFEYRSIVGDQGFYSNFELRFPLFDNLSSSIIRLGQVRGVFFADIGGAWFDDLGGFDFWDEDNDSLQDGIASYGYGLSVNFMGMDLNWDFAKRTNFERSDSDFKTSFWVGRRF